MSDFFWKMSNFIFLYSFNTINSLAHMEHAISRNMTNPQILVVKENYLIFE